LFPNGKGEFSAGWPAAAHKTEVRTGGLHKKGGPSGCGKGRGGLQKKAALQPVLFLSPASCAARQTALMCSPLAHPLVQPAGPPCCAARQPAENSCFSFGNTALQPARPAGPTFSVIQIKVEF